MIMITDRHLGLVIRTVWLINTLAEATLTEKIVRSYGWNGVLAYIAVDRQLIQEKLDFWHSSISQTCNGPRLYLPEAPVFPDVLDKSQHVVYIESGYVHFHDFKDFPDKSISVNGVEFGVVIPLLTEDPKGPPKFSLALSKFYQSDRGDPPHPNLSFPYLPVDELTMTDTSVVMRNGSDEIILSFERFNNPCKPAPAVSRHELEEFMMQDFQFGLPEPDFSFCDSHPSDNQFCQTVRSIQCELHRSSPNICQTSWYSDEIVTCYASVQIANISKGFRDFMMLSDGQTEVIASDSISGNYTMGLKYPCLE